MAKPRDRLSRFTGIRLMIAIQVFSFLFAIITGFFALEVGSVDLNKSVGSESFYTFKSSLQKILFPTLRQSRPAVTEERIPLNLVRNALNKMRLTVLLCGSVAFFSGLVLQYTIKHTLRQLTDSLRSVARGDFSASLQLYSQEEISQLARAYNRMVSSINRYMLETSTGATFTINRDGIITRFNPMAEIIFHRDYRDAVGSHFSDIFPVTRKNRSFVDILMRGLEKGEPCSQESVSILTQEEEKKATKVTTSILSSEQGKLLEVVAGFGDFEQIKEVQTQMERMNRLASLGSLVAGLAHEIRNPLGSLKGLAQLLGEDLPENDKKRQYTGIIVKEIDRLNRVVEELLSFAQPTSAEFEPLDINDIVRDALILAQTNFRHRPVEVVERYAPNLPRVVAERNRMVQAILNILTNAFEATPDEGFIIIETRLGQNGNLETPLEMPQTPRSVIIDFFNTGPSLSFGESQRMFDPFFTTKEKGTGLGLAIAQQVTTAHGGSLTVISQSESGGHEGITFRMELPVKGSAARILNGSPGPS